MLQFLGPKKERVFFGTRMSVFDMYYRQLVGCKIFEVLNINLKHVKTAYVKFGRAFVAR